MAAGVRPGRPAPRAYVPAHEPTRDAVYFYYTAAVARPAREIGLAAALVAALAADGSWANAILAVREDDPLVATAAAVTALVRCR